jgi:hypothetical protein
VKVVVIDESLNVTHEFAVNYDAELPQFKTKGGVHAGEGNSFTSPPQMWVAAINKVLLAGRRKMSEVKCYL